jgi:CBS domain-containing protein
VTLLPRMRGCSDGRAVVLDEQDRVIGVVSSTDISRALQLADLRSFHAYLPPRRADLTTVPTAEAGASTARPLAGRSYAGLFQVGEHLRRIRVHPVGTGAFELLTPVTSAEKPDGQGSGPLCGKQVPHAVPQQGIT